MRVMIAMIIILMLLKIEIIAPKTILKVVIMVGI